MSKRALITGITGQDGSYLAEHLIAEGYQVWGLIRGQANPRRSWVSRHLSEVRFVDGDLLDQASLVSAIDTIQPDEAYNLGAVSFVPMSRQQAELVTEINGVGVLRMLEAIRMVSGLTSSAPVPSGQIRFYQASSSEMFGKVTESPQAETTRFHPRSPYGVRHPPGPRPRLPGQAHAGPLREAHRRRPRRDDRAHRRGRVRRHPGPRRLPAP